MRDARTSRRLGQSGFSLIELLVVIGIIGIGAAIALPQISSYIRLYRIRGAANQVATAFQTARNRAISKNVNYGVDVVVGCNVAGCANTTFWVHVEDDQSTGHSSARQTLNFASPAAQQSTKATLPTGIVFATTTTQCPGLGGAPTTGWLQYNRLGSVCSSGCPTTPATPTAATSVIYSTAALNQLCLLETRTGVTRIIEIVPGGRIQQR